MSDAVWLAWVSLAAAVLGPIALAVAAWIKARSLATKGAVAEVHNIVNQQRTDMMAEIDRLRKEVASGKVTAKRLADAKEREDRS